MTDQRDDSAIRIGTAGWGISRAAAERFEGPGTHLTRYGRVFRGAEINSSFRRPHRASTYRKWAAATPDDFRFAVKLPRAITHDRKLRDVAELFEQFLEESSGLEGKRGPLLVQLPPSLAFDQRVAAAFFAVMRSRYSGPVACEPRHPSWFTSEADQLLAGAAVARVAADPSPAPGADRPAGWPGLVYLRLHGAPRVYWSRYDDPSIHAIADLLRTIPPGTERWCIFDNTASGAAIDNAWDLQALTGSG